MNEHRYNSVKLAIELMGSDNHDIDICMGYAEIIYKYLIDAEIDISVADTRNVKKTETELSSIIENSQSGVVLENVQTANVQPKTDERLEKIEKMIKELNPTDRSVMRKLLEKVEFKHLDAAYNQYLSVVLSKK